MCCFTGPVRFVQGTRIFARALGADRQLLVYSMRLTLDADVAMILPIPTPPRSSENALRWVDMKSCPTFFDQVDSLFPQSLAYSGGVPSAFAPQPARAPLVVHQVGAFEASFVPAVDDFDRLDARFRLPRDIWASLPQYADWGFAVFKLRTHEEHSARGPFDRIRAAFGVSPPAPSAPEGPRSFHPMAFEMPRRDPSRLFFPTLHVHDGAVHETANFDHALYAQTALVPADWTVGQAPGEGSIMGAAAWLDRSATVFKRAIVGKHPNVDVTISG